MAHIYKTKDVWTAIKFSAKNFIDALIIMSVLSFVGLSAGGATLETIKYTEFSIIGILLIMMVIQYQQNSAYTIDLNTGKITFPATDVETSFWHVIFLVPYWNLLRTKTVDASEIEGLYLDSNRTGLENTTGLFNLSVVGTFGSAKLEFVDRQKRDEVRNAIIQAVRKFRSDDLAFQVAEL